jgi:leucyl aminopeptidase (aminopeptidase T)
MRQWISASGDDMPDTAELKREPVNPGLRKGARNAARSCLGLGERDTVTLICDEASIRVAAALLEAFENEGAQCQVFILERQAPRPLDQLPPQIVRALERSTTSVYTVHPLDGEVAHRQQLIKLVAPLELKHAHMIRITEDAMQQAMLTDYRKVARLNPIVIERLRRGRKIRVTSKVGTDVEVTLDPAGGWDASAGVIGPGEWYNLPNGEVLTCPQSVDGLFVCNGVVPGDVPVDRFELMQRPLRIELKAGKLVNLSGGPGQMARDILATIRSGTNLDRIGMFAVGTNFNLLMPIGDLIQDMFLPGAYFSFGRSPVTGGIAATWEASAQLTFTGRKTTVEVDGFKMIDESRYDPSVLAEIEQ